MDGGTDEQRAPSGPLAVILGSGAASMATELAGTTALVVARHGDPSAPAGAAARFVPAHRVDHWATLERIAAAGCTRVLSVNSVGSLRTDWPVGTVVVPDDFFAPQVTPSRYDDERGHSVPGFDPAMRTSVLTAWRRTSDRPIVDGGVYAHTTGPRFETPAEVRFLATVADVVGMTVAAECILAREFGLAYAALCIVDNMANGLAPSGAALSMEEFTAGKDANRAALDRSLVALVEVLA